MGEERKKKEREKKKCHDKNEDILHWIKDNKVDTFGISETGLDWKNVPKNRHLKQHINSLRWGVQSKVITATNRHENNKK